MTERACPDPRCAVLNAPDAMECEECGKRLTLGFVDADGYRYLRAPNHHLAQRNGRVREHRLVAERMIGRRLRPGEVVHHINGDPTDNRPDNLVVCKDSAEHRRRFHNDAKDAA